VNTSKVKISRFLSYALRHKPEAIGLALDPQGWASIDDLLRRAAAAGMPITREILDDVVATNDKRRFAVSDDGARIRASQGHSIPVDLGLDPVTPPPTLYHGTASRFLDSILRSGLQPRGRQYVHLSADRATAVQVGRRHGKPVVLAVDAAALHATGHPFYLSKNGVWLTPQVPPAFLRQVDPKP
jgi:putative RNA 2'-phosphotransferase